MLGSSSSIIDRAVLYNQAHQWNDDGKMSQPPNPKLVVLSCMDPRMSNLPKILGLPHSEIDVIRTGGPAVTEDVIAELIVSNRVIGTREIMILNHTKCGFTTFTNNQLNFDLAQETHTAPAEPIDFFAYKENAMKHTKDQMRRIRSHPWIEQDVPVRGFVLDSDTGLLHEC